MVIIGGSGTGKSVLLKCILGLVRPDAGRIELDGQTM
jgi:phospholipid/cholesterol/gamma-HCH transport system ATP-binding protein